MDRDRLHPRRPAFSLVELVTVVAILAVLAGVALPRYANSLCVYHVQAAAARVAADLNLARTRARTGSLGQSVVFNVSGNAYTLPGVTPLNGAAGAAYAVSLAKEPYAATLVSAAFAGSATASFDRYGQPAAGGTVVVRSGTLTKTVVLDAVSGLASVQ